MLLSNNFWFIVYICYEILWCKIIKGSLMKLKLKIYYTNLPLWSSFACYNCFFIVEDKILSSKRPQKTWFLAFVSLGRNSMILPKPVFNSTGIVFYRNMGPKPWHDFLGLFLILTTMRCVFATYCKSQIWIHFKNYLNFSKEWTFSNDWLFIRKSSHLFSSQSCIGQE